MTKRAALACRFRKRVGRGLHSLPPLAASATAALHLSWPVTEFPRPSRNPSLNPSISQVLHPSEVASETERSGVPVWRVCGLWTAAGLAEPGAWRALRRALRGVSTAATSKSAASKAVTWDLRGIERLDHVGAQVLWDHWGRRWPAHLEAEDGQRRVLQTVARFSTPLPPRPAVLWAERLRKLGATLLQVEVHARGLLQLLGQLVLDMGRLLRRPQTGPWRDISGHLYNTGATALPITALVGFLIGVVLAYLLSRQLRQFGADAFIVDILGVALIRELGPMLAAILLAGRSGSAMTAQIGVMRVTEEIDAMRVMGIARGYRLVLPRALALMLVLPLLSTWTTLWALLGGMLASDLSMNVSPAFFISALPGAVQASNLTLALGKSAVFGLLIALLACHHGLRVAPNTESLGRGTTASVVSAITAVLLVDALFAVVFRNVGI